MRNIGWRERSEGRFEWVYKESSTLFPEWLNIYDMRQDESQKDQLDNEPKILLIHKKGGKEPPILLFSDGEVDMIGVHDQW